MNTKIKICPICGRHPRQTRTELAEITIHSIDGPTLVFFPMRYCYCRNMEDKIENYVVPEDIYQENLKEAREAYLIIKKCEQH